MKAHASCSSLGWSSAEDGHRLALAIVVLPDDSVAVFGLPLIDGRHQECIIDALTCERHPIKRLAILQEDGIPTPAFWMDGEKLVRATLRTASSS